MFFKNFLFFLLALFCCAFIKENNDCTSFELSRNYIQDECKYFKMVLPKSVQDACDYNKKKGSYCLHYDVIITLYNVYVVLTDFCKEKGYKWNEKNLWKNIITYAHSGISHYPSEITIYIMQKDESYIVGAFSYIILDDIFNVFEKKSDKFYINKRCYCSRNDMTEYIIDSKFSACKYTVSRELRDFIFFFQNKKMKNVFIDIGMSFYDVLIYDMELLYSRSQGISCCSRCVAKLFHKKLTHYRL